MTLMPPCWGCPSEIIKKDESGISFVPNRRIHSDIPTAAAILSNNSAGSSFHHNYWKDYPLK